MSNLSHKARTLTGLTIGPIVMSLLIEEILQADTKAWCENRHVYQINGLLD